MIGDECQGALDSDAFLIGDQAPAHSPLKSLLGVKDTNGELSKLEKAMSQYPVDIFEYVKDSTAPNGLRILIAD